MYQLFCSKQYEVKEEDLTIEGCTHFERLILSQTCYTIKADIPSEIKRFSSPIPQRNFLKKKKNPEK